MRTWADHDKNTPGYGQSGDRMVRVRERLSGDLRRSIR